MGRVVQYVITHEGGQGLGDDVRRKVEFDFACCDEPQQLVRLLGIRPGMTVADIGAGSGYYVVRLSPIADTVAQGKAGLQAEQRDYDQHRRHIARVHDAGQRKRRVQRPAGGHFVGGDQPAVLELF